MSTVSKKGCRCYTACEKQLGFFERKFEEYLRFLRKRLDDDFGFRGEFLGIEANRETMDEDLCVRQTKEMFDIMVRSSWRLAADG